MDCTRCHAEVKQVWGLQEPKDYSELVFCSCLCLFEFLRETFGDTMQKLKFSRAPIGCTDPCECHRTNGSCNINGGCRCANARAS